MGRFISFVASTRWPWTKSGWGGRAARLNTVVRAGRVVEILHTDAELGERLPACAAGRNEPIVAGEDDATEERRRRREEKREVSVGKRAEDVRARRTL